MTALPTVLRGARTHNLRGVGLTLDPGQVVVITGVSGSGKSSLAFDTLYAEGQRRFVESFSPYARQFLERLERPPMESLEPVAAAVAVDRKAPIKSSRSTLATMADLEPYLAALFARESTPYCPRHNVAAEALDPTQAAVRVIQAFSGEPAVITCALPVAGAEQYLEVRDSLLGAGYRRLWLGGQARELETIKPSEALAQGPGIEVVLDRVRPSAREQARIASDVEAAWAKAEGVVQVYSGEQKLELTRHLACPVCKERFAMAQPGLFSYASPLGACSACRGFGRVIGVDYDKVFPFPSLSLKAGAIRPWRGKSTTWERSALKQMCERHGISMTAPWESLPEAHRELVLQGDGSLRANRFPGVAGWFSWLETKAYKMHVRVLLSRYRSYDPCPACKGDRLDAKALAYRVAGRSLSEVHRLEVSEALAFMRTLEPRSGQGALIRSELEARLSYLDRVGLGYLSLDRQARTLSGGEAQRVTLTAALGASLSHALFVLDEPTVGLHTADIEPLLGCFRELALRNNTVLIVEHDPQVIRAADRVLELGPGAGAKGGKLTGDGPPELLAKRDGATARALREAGLRTRELRKPTGELGLRGARVNNLQGIDVNLPLGVLTVVTGRSGSGKSSLAVEVLYRNLAQKLGSSDGERPGALEALTGAESIQHVVLVDQAPLGRTSRGNAATYTKAWDAFRMLLAYAALEGGHDWAHKDFSFNTAGGRCEACEGQGYETVEMQFLADVRLICPSCQGKRFKQELLEVRVNGYNAAELLELTAEQALREFPEEAAVQRRLGPLAMLGLGHLRLGQPLSTLSGGEAQRVKLARALKELKPGSLFILDEPSCGLHADEVGHLLEAVHWLLEGGSSVVMVEHDLSIIRNADHVIDLGPGGGRAGGRVVGTGTPEQLARKRTATGALLSGAALRPSKARPKAVPRGKRRHATGPKTSWALEVKHAREHNLKSASASVPHGALTVVTGPSGSGKSTLAFDVIFAEGQRRFLETLTPYARQFLPTMPRPDVDSVTGVPPAVALEQRTTRAGAGSTVATVTEAAHYLRLAYAKLGVPHCPVHQEPIAPSRPEALLAQLKRQKGSFSVLSPLVAGRKGTYARVFGNAFDAGLSHAICDGKKVALNPPPKLVRGKEHTVDLVIAWELTAKEVDIELVEWGLRWGRGTLKLRTRGQEQLYSTRRVCPTCELAVPELDPRFFSFRTKQGQCTRCLGEGSIEPSARAAVARQGAAKAKARTKGRRAKAKAAEAPRVLCPDCEGSRLGPIPRSVRLFGVTYPELCAGSVAKVLEQVRSWKLTGQERLIGEPIVTELERRLSFLLEVGLGYLSLDRAAPSLSGGEMQRLRLAAQLGAGLTGALYVLDEPTIGLHPADTHRLLTNLRSLVKLGSTVLVVEHDEALIRAADHLIDLGPGGGSLGGEVMAEGSPAQVLSNESSPTGRALASPPSIRSSMPERAPPAWLLLEGASLHNLKHANLELMLGGFNVVAGLSGSGKSTLVRRVLLPAVRQALGLTTEPPGPFTRLAGHEPLRRAVEVDQSPIGRTPRSVPATFLGIWDHIRALFALSSEAKVAGFSAARFSFNTPQGGRCLTCEGQGSITHEMSFLPDVVSTCPACNGLRFEPQTLSVRYNGLSVGEVLSLTAEQAQAFFAQHPKIAAPLATLADLGAGYLTLGQGSHTLSGGEAQRLKLAAELTATRHHEPTLYVLDEPTTGLHVADVTKLMAVLSRLVERGDTLVVIEHHPQVMAGADHLIELGPTGGEGGGRIIAKGTPARVARLDTPTAKVIAALLEVPALRPRERRRKSEISARP